MTSAKKTKIAVDGGFSPLISSLLTPIVEFGYVSRGSTQQFISEMHKFNLEVLITHFNPVCNEAIDLCPNLKAIIIADTKFAQFDTATAALEILLSHTSPIGTASKLQNLPCD